MRHKSAKQFTEARGAVCQSKPHKAQVTRLAMQARAQEEPLKMTNQDMSNFLHPEKMIANTHLERVSVCQERCLDTQVDLATVNINVVTADQCTAVHASQCTAEN